MGVYTPSEFGTLFDPPLARGACDARSSSRLMASSTAISSEYCYLLADPLCEPARPDATAV